MVKLTVFSLLFVWKAQALCSLCVGPFEFYPSLCKIRAATRDTQGKTLCSISFSGEITVAKAVNIANEIYTRIQVRTGRKSFAIKNKKKKRNTHITLLYTNFT